MKRSWRKHPGIEQTDEQMMHIYRRLPVQRQREIFHQMLEESRELDRVLPFDEVLSTPIVLEEVQRLARGAGVPISEMARIVNPRLYSSYFARSPRCTMARLTAVDYARCSDAAEVMVSVKVYRQLDQKHTIVPADFDLYVRSGSLEIRRQRSITRCPRGSVVTIEAQGEAQAEVTIRAYSGCWFIYSEHPLTAWIASHAKP